MAKNAKQKGSKKGVQKAPKPGGKNTIGKSIQRTGKNKTTGLSKLDKEFLSQKRKGQIEGTNYRPRKGTIEYELNELFQQALDRKQPRISEEDELQNLFLQQLENRETKRTSKNISKNTKGKSGAKTKDRRVYKYAGQLAKLSVTKKRDDNLIYIRFTTRSIQKLLLALNANDFRTFEQMTFPYAEFVPYYIVVILRIKRPDQKSPWYISFKSDREQSVATVDLMKSFVTQVVADYNNNMADLIDEKYDEPTRVYPIVEIGVRFIYPITNNVKEVTPFAS